MSLIPFCCVFRSFYGSKSRIRPNIVPVSIPQANISEDDLQTSSEPDDDFDASRDESIDYELTEEEIIESGSEFEQDDTEEPPSSNSHVEIKFKWDSNVKWTIPQDSLFEKQKLQVKIEQNKRLNVYSSPWSFFFFIFHRGNTESHHISNKFVQ